MMKDIWLSQQEILILLAALDDYEQVLSDRGKLDDLHAAAALYDRFDRLRFC